MPLRHNRQRRVLTDAHCVRTNMVCRCTVRSNGQARRRRCVQVNALTFNPKAANIVGLATAAGEVMIVDIGNPRAPRQGWDDQAIGTYAPAHAGGAACEALSLRFNNVNERILAVGFGNGVTHIFDTRKQRAVIQFMDDNAPRRTAALAWAPAEQTSIVLASDDDRSPTLQFWELRQPKAPRLEYAGHSRGVTDVAWCPHDPRVLLSAGKDDQTLLWDARSGDRLGALDTFEPGAAIQVRPLLLANCNVMQGRDRSALHAAPTCQARSADERAHVCTRACCWGQVAHMMQVAFSPLSKGAFISCQAGRAVRLASFTGIAATVESATDPATGQDVSTRVSRPLNAAPAWLRRPCVARFGWGGKLATVRPPAGKDTARVVVVNAVAAEPTLKVHSERFEAAMHGDLRAYCAQKVTEETSSEADFWGFIEARSSSVYCVQERSRALPGRLAEARF